MVHGLELMVQLDAYDLKLYYRSKIWGSELTKKKISARKSELKKCVWL